MPVLAIMYEYYMKLRRYGSFLECPTRYLKSKGSNMSKIHRNIKLTMVFLIFLTISDPS